MIDDCELLTERAVATALKVSARTLQRMVAEGRGPPRIQISDRRVGYRVADVRAWIAGLGHKAAA